MASEIEQLRFLSNQQVRALATKHSTPIYVYSRQVLRDLVDEVKQAFAQIDNLTIRYAMKANPHPQILKLFQQAGLGIDASSEFEAQEALEAGFSPKQILLTSQQLPANLNELTSKGVEFTATSLHQLEQYGQTNPNSKVSIRLNTGIGSGENHRLTTGGIEVGFGIWFYQDDNQLDLINLILEKYDLEIERVHIHIGTGSDPDVWSKLMDSGLYAMRQFPSATTLNLGGGFKVAYMDYDQAANLPAIASVANQKLKEFSAKTGRNLNFEIEPGRYLVAKAGSLISTIIDQSNTGDKGDVFLRLNTGMTDFIRTAMYGSHHPLVVVPKIEAKRKHSSYVVVGHCCESSDIFTTKRNDPETIQPRPLLTANIGDYMVIELTGAYCASMSTNRYNSFPQAKEIFI